jgi:hypothetical protein
VNPQKSEVNPESSFKDSKNLINLNSKSGIGWFLLYSILDADRFIVFSKLHHSEMISYFSLFFDFSHYLAI